MSDKKNEFGENIVTGKTYTTTDNKSGVWVDGGGVTGNGYGPPMTALYMISPPRDRQPMQPLIPLAPMPTTPAPTILQVQPDPRIDELVTLVSALVVEVERLAALIEKPKKGVKRAKRSK